jgi:hypothetical protein
MKPKGRWRLLHERMLIDDRMLGVSSEDSKRRWRSSERSCSTRS